MKTTPLNDHLIQLTRYGFVNAYLVREDDGFTLVDTTMPKTGEALIAAAAAAGGRIRRIALTHGHGDHVGDALDIAEKTGAPVITNYDLCMWLAGKGLKKVVRSSKGAATVTLPIKPVGKTKKQLAKAGKAKLVLSFTFAPTGGTAKRTSKTVKLLEK